MLTKHAKLDILRDLESFIYQVAYYLLNDEKPAVEASKQTVMEVLNDDHFFQLDHSARINFIRKVTIYQSLHVHFENK